MSLNSTGINKSVLRASYYKYILKNIFHSKIIDNSANNVWKNWCLYKKFFFVCVCNIRMIPPVFKNQEHQLKLLIKPIVSYRKDSTAFFCRQINMKISSRTWMHNSKIDFVLLCLIQLIITENSCLTLNYINKNAWWYLDKFKLKISTI